MQAFPVIVQALEHMYKYDSFWLTTRNAAICILNAFTITSYRTCLSEPADQIACIFKM